jgi:hypothetical protein
VIFAAAFVGGAGILAFGGGGFAGFALVGRCVGFALVGPAAPPCVISAAAFGAGGGFLAFALVGPI